MRRFERLWQDWDKKVREGQGAHEILPTLQDETVVEMLASAGDTRRYERNLLATEALNRMTRARREVEEATTETGSYLEDLRATVDEAAERVHATEKVAEVDAQTLHDGPPTEATKTAHAASLEIERVRSEVEGTAEAQNRLDRMRDEVHRRARDHDEANRRTRDPDEERSE